MDKQKFVNTLNGVFATGFFLILIYMTATGLMWRLPHYLQAIFFFAAGSAVMWWVRYFQKR